MNSVSLVGNLTKTPEAISTADGKSITRFTIAINGGKDKNGNNLVDYPQIVAFGKVADFVISYIDKGDKVAVNGRIHTRSYDAQDGLKRYVTEVVAQTVEAMSKPSQNGTECEMTPVEDCGDLPF